MSFSLCLILLFQGPTLRPKAAVRAIEAVMTEQAFDGAFWGLAVYAPLRGEMLVDHHADRNFRPASNMKILTTLLAMDYLGPDYVFQTRLTAAAEPVDGVLSGDLLVIGGGDPSLSGNYADGAYSTQQLLNLMVADLQRRGVREIRGDLVADLSFFDSTRVQYSWEWDDVGNYYATPIAPLAINDGHVDIGLSVDESGHLVTSVAPYVPPGFDLRLALTHDPGTMDIRSKRTFGSNRLRIVGNLPPCSNRHFTISVWDTPAHFMAAFRDGLARAGISVTGEIRFTEEPRQWQHLLAVYESEPLAKLAQVLMKESQNHYADAFLKTTAAHVMGEGSFDAGGQLARDFAQRLRPGFGQLINVRDGSGLSAQNNLQPGVIIALLRHGLNQPYRDAWLKTFPVLGVDGTLSRRAKQAPNAVGFVWAKTGYIFRSRALSGYVETAAGEPLIFSMMVNNYACPTAVVNAAQDRICGVLRRLKPNRSVRLQKDRLYQLSTTVPYEPVTPPMP